MACIGGVGIFYKADKFQLLKRRGAQRGAWGLLRHLVSGAELWVGSIHLPNNEPRDEVNRNIKDVIDSLPRKAEKAIILGDYNVQFCWRHTAAGVDTGAMTAKWAGLRQLMMNDGFQQVRPRPSQTTTPTFHSRKGNVASTQIDGAFLRGPGQVTLDVCEGSRHEVGTDHDRIEVMLSVQHGSRPVRKTAAGGPRTLVSEPPSQTVITQDSLKQLAKQHTKPLSLGPKFQPSEATRTLAGMAKHGRDPQLWKQYRMALRKDKEQWTNDRLERACADWATYKSLTRGRKSWGRSTWSELRKNTLLGQSRSTLSKSSTARVEKGIYKRWRICDVPLTRVGGLWLSRLPKLRMQWLQASEGKRSGMIRFLLNYYNV